VGVKEIGVRDWREMGQGFELVEEERVPKIALRMKSMRA